MWIKICGTTSLEDAQLALDAGADALGFVFAPSPRRITPDQAAAITAKLPAPIQSYGVFVEPSFDEVVAAVERANLTGVQLHAASHPALGARLRAYFSQRGENKSVTLLRVVHFSPRADQFAAQLTEAANAPIDAVLIDTRTASAHGGTGTPFDWNAASATLKASGLRLIVAGGLNPQNVAQAIQTLHPWGVDVVTGVEAAPGRKDSAKLRAFIAAARAADSHAHRL